MQSTASLKAQLKRSPSAKEKYRLSARLRRRRRRAGRPPPKAMPSLAELLE